MAKGDQSVAAYDAWLERPDGADEASSPTLAALREYNRDDCVSTRELADWLWGLRMEHGPPGVGDRFKDAGGRSSHDVQHTGGTGGETKNNGESKSDGGTDTGSDAGTASPPAVDARTELAERVESLRAALESADGWADGSKEEHLLSSPSLRSLLASLLTFHEREAKPAWWRRFEWLKAPPEVLTDDAATLGDLYMSAREPYKQTPRSRRLVYEFGSTPTAGTSSGSLESSKHESSAHPSSAIESSGTTSGYMSRESRGSSSAQECKLGDGSAVVVRNEIPDESGEEDFPLGAPATLRGYDHVSGVALLECSHPPASRVRQAFFFCPHLCTPHGTRPACDTYSTCDNPHV